LREWKTSLSYRDQIEKLESDEISRRLRVGYYSEDAEKEAIEVLRMRGIKTSEQVADLAESAERERDEDSASRKNSVKSFLMLLAAPYLYFWLVESLAFLPAPAGSLFALIWNLCISALAFWSIVRLFKYTYRTFGSRHKILFGIFFIKTVIFLAFVVFAVVSLSVRPFF
jgi:hypothetical protein